jgi:multicomponent Na+:H+ antiporter subunit B
MPSLILSTATRYLLPLLLLASVYLLLRGHNAPGGGFVGGLVAAAAFTLYVISDGVAAGRRLLRVDPHNLIGSGLLTALGSGLLGPLLGAPFLVGLWLPEPLPVVGKMGTPILFDIGVYLTVLGVMLLTVFALAEE